MTQVNSPNARTASLGELVEGLVRFEGPPEQFLVHLLTVQCRAGLAQSGALFVPDKGGLELVAISPAMGKDQPAPTWVRHAATAGLKVLNSGRVVIVPVREENELYGAAPQWHVIVLPLLGASALRGVAAFRVQSSDPDVLSQRCERLELTMSLLSLYEMRSLISQRDGDLQKIGAALNVIAEVNAHRHADAVAMALCNTIAANRVANRVSIGMLHGRYIRLWAMSHTEKFTREMKLVQDIEAAMEESMDQDSEVLFPSPADAMMVARCAEMLSQRYGPSAICSLPLRLDGKVVGVLTIERPTEHPFHPVEVEFVRLVCDLVTPRLVELKENDRWLGAVAVTRFKKLAQRAVGPEDTWIKLIVIAVLGVILFSLLFKGPYRAEAPFAIDAIKRQIVAAPFDGYLKNVEVEPGTEVKKDETVLAQIDKDELELKLAASQAEQVKCTKQSDLSRRDGKIAESLIYRSQADKALAESHLYEYQIQRSTLKAPIDGRVIAGDLKKQVGMTVQSGQTLFEIAPLDALRAELLVPESEAVDVKVGDKGSLSTAAEPTRYLPFEVEMINPIAEVIGRRNVFRVRVKLLEIPTSMKPGITGVAKIEIGRRRYVWLWTHQMVDWIRLKLWI